ncbi:hypothetical protein OBBRIDRAFT_836365 [Obba rivulosa]|uniref:DNA endonuclease activator Ctp1 C-terminal domain-containing protein n=1 Tax=Obba rivulosa TaxID=1052685 RepID=A0A8E2APU6_9APHY|nr:hypothetical protein OBBRIDRAFT_836365 [Obba rivulosa]
METSSAQLNGTTSVEKQLDESVENKLFKLSNIKEKLNMRVSAVTQRAQDLATRLGFVTIDEAESAFSANPDIFNREFIEKAQSRIDALREELADLVRHGRLDREKAAQASRVVDELRKQNAGLTEELATVKRENNDLRSRVEELERRASSTHPPLATSGLPTPAQTVKRPTHRKALPVHLHPSSDDDLHVHSSDTFFSPVPAPTSHLVFPSVPADVPTDPSLLAQQLHDLQQRYAALRTAKERNEAKHEKDLIKWRNFKQWVCAEEGDVPVELPFDDAVPDMKLVKMVRKGYKKKQEQETGSPSGKRRLKDRRKQNARPINDENAAPCTSSAESSPRKRVKTRHLGDDLSTPAPLAPLFAKKVEAVSTLQEKLQAAAAEIMPAPVVRPRKGMKRKRDEVLIPNLTSSDTEDDSQAPDPVFSSSPPRLRKHPAKNPLRIQDPSTGAGAREPTPKEEDVFSGFSPLTPISCLPLENTPGLSTAKAAAPSDPRALEAAESSLVTPVPRAGSSNEHEPGSSTAKRNPADYTIYKGRGRYATNARAGADTINALYEIDGSRNDGRGFQFDDVVRSREQRKNLHAGDCECCHDYYEAIGPLPSRLQPPLWRSPESTPSKPSARPHKHLGAPHPASSMLSASSQGHLQDSGGAVDCKDQEQAIMEHKHQISRHRHQWERAKTPPGYWDIGFPDTQKAAELNRQAARMHEQKRRMIEQEASVGGRYKKRQ